MEKPRVGHITTNYVELGWMVPPVGPMSALSEEEGDELLKKTAEAAQWFSVIFTAALADPTYLNLVNQVMRTAADMVRAEMEERNDAVAQELRDMMEEE